MEMAGAPFGCNGGGARQNEEIGHKESQKAQNQTLAKGLYSRFLVQADDAVPEGRMKKFPP